MSKESEAKGRILQTAVDILEEGQDPDSVTVRQIATRAGVAVGAINYYFQSKDKLLNEAVGVLMLDEAARHFTPSPSGDDDPQARLRALLQQTSLIGVRYPQLLEVSIRYELEQGRFSVAEMIVPLLREIADGRAGETEIRLLALQLITSLQVMFLRRDEVQRFTGIDVNEEEQLQMVIDALINNTLSALRGCKD